MAQQAELTESGATEADRLAEAGKVLLDAGRDARNLVGGKREWAVRGLPVVACDGSPGDVL